MQYCHSAVSHAPAQAIIDSLVKVDNACIGRGGDVHVTDEVWVRARRMPTSTAWHHAWSGSATFKNFARQPNCIKNAGWGNWPAHKILGWCPRRHWQDYGDAHGATRGLFLDTEMAKRWCVPPNRGMCGLSSPGDTQSICSQAVVRIDLRYCKLIAAANAGARSTQSAGRSRSRPFAQRTSCEWRIRCGYDVFACFARIDLAQGRPRKVVLRSQV